MSFSYNARCLRIDCFGLGEILQGYAVSWQPSNDNLYTDRYAIPYNGTNLLGVSCHNVVHVDTFRYNMWLPSYTIEGSKINIIEEGEITLPKRKSWLPGTPITIGKQGQLKRARKQHKVYGEVQSIHIDYAKIFFRKWGL